MSTLPNAPATGPGTLTDDIYRQYLDPARRALIIGASGGTYSWIPYSWLTNPNWYNANLKLGYSAASQAAAATLLTNAQLSGLPIDMDLMLRLWSAPMIMAVRKNDGYEWVPPYGSPDVNVGPGLPPPVGEIANYPATMPAGWIPVSTDAKDYPAYVAPVVPVAPIVWVPNLSVMLMWAELPVLDPETGIMTPGKVQYYFGTTTGQKPPIGTPCNYQGSAFVAAYYPNPEPIGGMITMWLLIGPAASAA